MISSLPSPRRLVRRLAASALAASALLLVACAPDAPPGAAGHLDDLRDGIALADPVVVAPGPRWQLADGAFGFRNRGALACPIGTAEAGAPLELSLHLAEGSRGHHFVVSWDDEILDEGLGGDDEGVLRLEVPAERLATGPHVLALRRDYRADAPGDRTDHDNHFTALRYRLGDHEGTLDAESWPRRREIADFVLTGVIGDAREEGLLHGGLLFVGSVERVVEVPAEATLRVVGRNLSPRKATLRVGVEEATVAPGGEHRFRVRAGDDTVLLAAKSGGWMPGTSPGASHEHLVLWSRASLEDGEPALRRPPVILVTLDTTRRDALGPYGAEESLTPHLDDLAAEATVFDHAFSTSPWTLPSHASIFTGLYPSRHGAGVSRVRLPRSPDVLAERLRARGYGTAGISAGHLSSSEFGISQGFELFRDPDRWETPGANVATYAEDFLDRLGDRPFFLWINYFDPHALYEAPERFQERLGVPDLRARVSDAPLWERFFAGEIEGWRGILEGQAQESPAALRALRASYQAEIAYTDHLLGRLFAGLRERGLWERSLVIVTADHGELLGEGGYFSHGARLDPELVEIPLLIKWPEGHPGTGGGRDDRLVSLVDLYPTVLRAAGLEPPPGDGIDLAPGDPGDAARRYVLLEEHEALVHPLPAYMKIAPHLFGVQRRGDRRVVWHRGPDEAAQTCAIRDGERWTPGECTAEPSTVLRLVLDELGSDAASPHDAAPVDESQVPEDQRKALEALGYI